MKSPIRKILSVAANIIVWIIVVVAALFVFMTLSSKQSGVPNLFGFSPMNILSDSMKGDKKDNFDKGDLIIVKKFSDEEKNNLKVGDIITFNEWGGTAMVLNTHRIIEVKTYADHKMFVTKGDNSPVKDGDDKGINDIYGKYVTKVSGFGKVLDFLKSTVGFLLCLVLPVFLFFVWRLIKLIGSVIEYKKLALAEEEKNALEGKTSGTGAEETTGEVVSEVIDDAGTAETKKAEAEESADIETVETVEVAEEDK